MVSEVCLPPQGNSHEYAQYLMIKYFQSFFKVYRLKFISFTRHQIILNGTMTPFVIMRNVRNERVYLVPHVQVYSICLLCLRLDCENCDSTRRAYFTSCGKFDEKEAIQPIILLLLIIWLPCIKPIFFIHK